MASFTSVAWYGAEPLVFEILPYIGSVIVAFLIVRGALANYDDSDDSIG